MSECAPLQPPVTRAGNGQQPPNRPAAGGQLESTTALQAKAAAKSPAMIIELGSSLTLRKLAR
jgi:hypothetical protein